jgi:DNA repair protein RecO (recombination protein O)
MSEIIKTEAIVLSKMNYGDTSNILSVYSREYGKLSVIIKGARSPKSKSGYVADPPNQVQIVIYKKDTRDIQILSSIDLISHFSHLKEDIDKLKYSFAIIELVKKLTPEHETNVRLFNGLSRILSLIDSSKGKNQILFGRFFLFFLKEIGYEVQLDKCVSCGTSNLVGENLAYNFDLGILCTNCSYKNRTDFKLSQELFDYLLCLNNNKSADIYSEFTLDKAIIFMERYLKFHVPDFKGIQAFQTIK